MVKVNDFYCKGCGYCIKFCPKNVLAMGNERNARGFFFPVLTDSSNCISCGICETMCPDIAIEVQKEEGK